MDINRKVYNNKYRPLLFKGNVLLYGGVNFQKYGIGAGSMIEMIEPENNYDKTNVNAINKRGKIGKQYYYVIKGSNEGNVWGDHIYSDDSNIAKAAVLEGICNLGELKVVGIRMIEGKSSYSSAYRNGVSSSSWSSWNGSYIFTENSYNS